ncbi:MAG: polyprenol phosphomannose-dependent alpha 1,6 mannosyltransferase MptB [Acidimicrobiales bacterium]
MGAPTAVHEARGSHGRGAGAARSLPLWIALGWCGAMGMVLTGTRIGAVPDPHQVLWWFTVPSTRSPVDSVVFYCSLALLLAGWVGVGREARSGGLTVGRAWVVLAVWGLPFLLGPPLFSQDLYSYVGQGLVAHRGMNPYTEAPSVLGPGPILNSIASVWRHTTSPYGPLFVAPSKVIAALAGGSLVVQVLAFRAFELIGVVLVMVSLPRLARHLGTDPGMALWLGALSPLALFSFVASGHNDALMVGLLVAGVTVAVTGRMLPGLVLCALAATAKLPAAAAVVFLAVDRAGSETRGRRWRVLGEAVAVLAVVFVGVTVVCGDGWTWLGPTALHIPTELRVQSTPSVSLGVLFFHLLHPLGIPVTGSAVVTVTQDLVALATVVAIVWLLATVRRHEVVRSTALALILIVVGSPTVWPWYLMWGLVLLAATTAQRSNVLAVVAGLAMLVVGPSGHPLLGGSWYLVVSLGTLAGCGWLVRGRRWKEVVTGHAA